MSNPSPETELHDRYPGPRSFRDDEAERRLFFGRDQEIETLTHRIRAARLLVLFGKSGLGKTSLLQAGVYANLREYGFLPIPVRFDQPGADPVETIIEATLAACRENQVEALPGTHDGLWMFFRTTDLWHGDELLTPVLVLDQFEEVFTLHDAGFRKTLAAELRDLAGRGLPEAARRLPAEEGRRLSGDLPLRMVLSLREEFLGTLEEMVAEVPEILETRFRLLPLDEARARSAIEDPATTDDNTLYRSDPFGYAAETLNKMLKRLSNRRGEFEPFQLQVLCQHVERQVVEQQEAGEVNVTVDDRVLPSTAMTEVLRNFYRDSLRAIPGSWERRRARKLCERGLLSPDDKRVSLEESGLQRTFKLRPASLSKLVDTRLLRRDTRPGLEGFYYELSHDSLVEPVRGSRARKGRALRILSVSPMLLLLTVFVAWDTVVSQANVAAVRITYALGKSPSLPALVEIPSGSFMMGSEQGEDREKPRHEVRIASPFYLSATEITFDQYDGFAATTGRQLPDDIGWGRGNRPAIYVNWDDAQAYAMWLGAQTINACRLPSEAEWEYAARAGTETDFALPAPSGGDDLAGKANCYDCAGEWAGTSTAPVASFSPNAWGLHDMHGNVFEWVEDCYHDSYDGAPTDGSAGVDGDGSSCFGRVVRGGSWYFSQYDVRSTYRDFNDPVNRSNDVGFRVLCSSPIL